MTTWQRCTVVAISQQQSYGLIPRPGAFLNTVCVLSCVCVGSLPPSRDMRIRLTGNSKFFIGVSLSVNVELSLWCDPVINWWLGHCVILPLLNVSWSRLQHPHDPECRMSEWLWNGDELFGYTPLLGCRHLLNTWMTAVTWLFSFPWKLNWTLLPMKCNARLIMKLHLYEE